MDDGHRALEVLGLSNQDQAVYEALVASGNGVVTDIPDPAAAGRLTELGLLVRLPDEPERWAVVAPDVALGPLISAQRHAVDEARQRMARLAVRYQRAVAGADRSHLVEVVHGAEAVQRAFEDLVKGARREIRMCDAPPYILDCEDSRIQRELLGRGIRWRTLYDRQSVAVPGRLAYLRSITASGEQARIADIPMKLILSDQPLGLVPPRLHPVDPDRLLLVRDSVLLSALSALFELCWEQAIPMDLGVGESPLPEKDAPSGRERELLSLLVSGLTDRAISEHLGCHPRTVQRQLRDLLATLGAATRFQAGYQAVQRGWLHGQEGPQR